MMDAILPEHGASGPPLSMSQNWTEVAAAATAAEAAEAQERKRKIYSRIFLYTGVAATAAGGYAYTQYSSAEINQALSEAKQQPKQMAYEFGARASQPFVQGTHCRGGRGR